MCVCGFFHSIFYLQDPNLLLLLVATVPFHWCVTLCYVNILQFLTLTRGYLYWFFRERRRERENHQCEREISIGWLLYPPWLGIEPSTFWCMGWCSKKWSHPTRAENITVYLPILLLIGIGLFPGLGYYKRCCYKHSCVCFVAHM